jgi:hypothetical protein
MTVPAHAACLMNPRLDMSVFMDVVLVLRMEEAADFMFFQQSGATHRNITSVLCGIS